MSNLDIKVTIGGKAPNYNVELTPPDPYRVEAPGSTLTLTLSKETQQAGFRMVGIGFDGRFHNQCTEPSQGQLCANIAGNGDNTLIVTDHCNQKGQFEFLILYTDGSGVIYGHHPEVLNDID